MNEITTTLKLEEGAVIGQSASNLRTAFIYSLPTADQALALTLYGTGAKKPSERTEAEKALCARIRKVVDERLDAQRVIAEKSGLLVKAGGQVGILEPGSRLASRTRAGRFTFVFPPTGGKRPKEVTPFVALGKVAS